MSATDEANTYGPHNGHLGTSWEIAVVVVFVVLLVVLLSTLAWQIRRKQRRRQQERLDLERGTQREKVDQPSSSRHEPRRPASAFVNGSAASLPMPEPSAPKSNRSSRISGMAPSDHPSQKPPQRYYWDPR
ncbi:hypothetical protein ONZ45_g5581 [Pleurotus djamor]|nr:hypothetical protein ONZ45_g5581 [Pleurotus djamor]